ncbi:ABC transporter substrate-binding protein [Reinekea marinisedimentorum]|uniref:NitT/TauT family transport system ATP-binding protein/nitrate/nitrite transport system substrate-binding protein n=1 Tax=Reinekea marinisedimentorum TaxID=230495 RepID=A0A4R3I336_9GAMM|nr:ABC transporter substrate-binding protein [Reinekea marinisedimentorum]TCS39992.1 NitT/TauT family transport system ATP-binding protein/nitrate/nitrite transport system substrate-binding protein [Reinekea marinisedimentorum]
MQKTSAPTQQTVRIGYVPLVDAAPLIIAKEAGFFLEENLDIVLHRESNWASIRDKLSLGLIDAAHMLAPMVFASHITPPNSHHDKSFMTAMALGYNGNAITLSNPLFDELNAEGKSLDEILAALKAYVDASESKLTFGSVHPFSMHTNLLLLLLKRAGIDKDKIEIKVIPPVRMVDAIRDGLVDLFCVGEPWNTAAQFEKAGKIICYGSDLWSHAPEKVLGLNSKFARQNRETHIKVLRAIVRACQWLEEPDHMAQAALWLASKRYLDCSSDLLLHAMVNQWQNQANGSAQRKIFFSQNANAPWPQHAKWISDAIFNPRNTFATDGQWLTPPDQIYDWEIFSQVMTSLGLPVPNTDDCPGTLPKL